MNAIIEIQSGSSTHVRQGWANVLKSIGWNVQILNIEKDCVNDVFDKMGKVDIFLGTTYNLNRSYINQINKRPDMKIALYCSGYGDLLKDIDLKEYPVQVVGKEEKEWVGRIAKRISCCHIHIQDNLVGPYIGGWTKEFGIPTIGVMNGADLFTYGNAKPQEKYNTTVGFVGGNWSYKGRNLNKTLVRLCREQWKNFDIKIFGSGWDVPQCLGNAPLGDDAAIFSSSKISPNVSEPHSTNTQINDLVERIFKIPVANGFLICDNVDLKSVGLHVHTPQFKDYDEFLDLIKYYSNPDHENVRKCLIFKQKEIVWTQHSYFERMFKLLNAMNLNNEANKLLQKKKELFDWPKVRITS